MISGGQIAAACLREALRRRQASLRLLLCGLLSILMPSALSAQVLRLDFTPAIIPVLEQEGWSKILSGRVIHQTFRALSEQVSYLGLFPLDDGTGFAGGIRVAVYAADDEGNPEGAPLFSHLVENAEWREAVDTELRVPLLAPNLEPGNQYVLELKSELPSVSNWFSLRGSALRGPAFKNNDELLRADGKFLGYAQVLAFRLYSFAATETPSLAGVALFSGRALTGLQIALDNEGRARFAYSGVGILEFQRAQERKCRYIADAVRIRNINFNLDVAYWREVFWGADLLDKTELTYDLACLRPDLGPLALSYSGYIVSPEDPHGIRVSVSADGKNYETISRNQLGQVLVFQKRFLRFQMSRACIRDFQVWSWRPVAIPGLKAALNNSAPPVRDRIAVEAGYPPAVIRSADELPPLPASHPDPWTAQNRAVQNVFPLGMAFSFESAYTKNLGIDYLAFLARVFDDFAAHNVNALYIMNGDIKSVKEQLDLAEPRGIRLLPMMCEIMMRYHAGHRGRGRFDQFRRNAALVAGQLRSRDGLLAYLLDEELPWPEEIRTYSDILRRYDPGHAVLNLQAVGGNKRIIGRNSDLPVTMTDLYPRQHYLFMRDFLERFLDEEVALAQSIGANFWYMGQCQAADRPRLPDPGELRLMAWMAVARGAKGLFYWHYSAVRRKGHFTATPQWRAIGEIYKDLGPLMPLLLACRPDPYPPVYAADAERADARALRCIKSGLRIAVVANRQSDRPADVKSLVDREIPGIFDLLTLQSYSPIESEAHANVLTLRLGPGCGTLLLLGTREQFEQCVRTYALKGGANLIPLNIDKQWEEAVTVFEKTTLQRRKGPELARAEAPDTACVVLTKQDSKALFFRVINTGPAREIPIRISAGPRGDIYSFSSLRETEAEKSPPGEARVYRVWFEEGASTLFMLPESGNDFMTLLDAHF